MEKRIAYMKIRIGNDHTAVETKKRAEIIMVLEEL